MTNPADEAGERRGIYTASKTKHADKWRDLRAKGWPIIATWIDEAGAGESGDLADLWDRCVSESSGAAALLLYREPDEVLKGAWTELGCALATGVPVFAVGIEEFTVHNHRGIRHFATLDAALVAISSPLPEDHPMSDSTDISDAAVEAACHAWCRAGGYSFDRCDDVWQQRSRQQIRAALFAARPHLVTDRGEPSEGRVEAAARALALHQIEINIAIDDRPRTDEFIKHAIDLGWSNFAEPARAALSASDALAPAAGQPVELEWDGRPTPAEAASLLRAYAIKRNLPPRDNNFDDAASVIERLEAMLRSALSPIPERVNAVDLREAAHLAHTAGMTAPTVKEHDDLFEEASVLSRTADWLDRFAHLPRDRKGE